MIEGGLAFFDADDLAFRSADGDEEYMGYSARYDDFDYHTFVTRSKVAEEVLRARELRKLRYLRSAFASVLAGDEKIMVRASPDSRADIDRLSDLLRRRGSRWLLWVDQADEEHAAGSVCKLADGLLKGFLAHHATFDDEPRIDIQSWLRVCKSAYALAEREDGRLPPPPRSPLSLGIDDAWRHGTFARTIYPDPVTRPRIASSCLLIEPEIAPQEALVEVAVDHDLSSRSLLVFSAWIFVPHGFRGSLVEARMSGTKTLHLRRADLAKRDVWQQVWCAGRTQGSTRLVINLNVAAEAGSTLYVAGYRLETGSIPTAAQDAAEYYGRRRSRWLPLRRLRLKIADHLIDRGKHRRADRLIERGLSLYPHDLAFYVRYARNASAAAAWPAAVDRWMFATRAAFGMADCHRMMAASLRQSGRWGGAATVIHTAMKLFPKDRAIREEAASISTARGRHIEAARHRRSLSS